MSYYPNNQPQYPPYQSAPPQPYPAQPPYQNNNWNSQPQPNYPQNNYEAFNPSYGAPPPQTYNPPPPQPAYNSGPYGAPPPPQPYGAQPFYGGGGGGGGAAPPQPPFYLGSPISPLEGMSMGPPLPPFAYNAQFDAERIRNATKGWGTDESTLIDTLAPLGGLEIDALGRTYEGLVGRSLVKTLEKETRGWFLYGLRALALGPLGADCWFLNRACAGAGTHEDLLSEVLLGRTNNEIYLLKAAYKAIYNKDLLPVVKGELSEKTERMFIMALAGSRDESGFVNQAGVQQDVDTLYRAGEGRWGTDEITVLSILITRSPAHLAALAQAYRQRNSRPLTAAVSREFSGHMKEGLLFIARGAEEDGVGVCRDAEMLEEAMAGMGTKDERLIYRLVRLHWDRQRFENVKRAYEAKYGRSLRSRVHGETMGDYRKLMQAIIQ